jgi:hypothetical protein
LGLSEILGEGIPSQAPFDKFRTQLRQVQDAASTGSGRSFDRLRKLLRTHPE